MRNTPFFIGFLPIPKELRGFLSATAAGLIALFTFTGWLIGANQDDPGNGAFRFDLGRQTVIGVVELHPYPLLRVTRGSEAVPAGHTLMMTGIGKRGIMNRAAPLDGQLAMASGVLLQRGDLTMIQLRGGERGLKAEEGRGPAVETEKLGRWRLVGEICDGKCLAGAMRPGRGLAHKACANLCITGGVPPVFVSTQPVEGSEFLLIGGTDGAGMDAELYDHVGAFVEVEGDIERRGSLLVFRPDPATVKTL